MKIYLARHGEANSADIDPEKGLSDKGKTDITRIAEMIRHLDIVVTEIYHSGKARAEQTASILSQTIQAANGISKKQGLEPNDPIEPVADELRTLVENIMIVGHLPFMAKLASLLISQDDHKSLFDWQPGSIACIEQEKGKFTLQWFINPEVAAADMSGQFSSYH